jgi:hypothetical protein
MKCPNCGDELVGGEAFFKKSAADFVAFGLGSEDLRMKTEKGDEFLLLAASEKAPAQFCRECGVAVLATEKGRRSAMRKPQS